MKKIVRSLASLKISVSLLVALLLGLAVGTIVESASGAEAAGRLVYYSPWFLALQGAFALNVLCSLAVHWPFGRSRIGFATTHGALLLILVGAGATWAFKQEGHLMLWEGETGSVVTDRGSAENAPATRIVLPFAVRLEKFTIQRYPGMMMPAGFRSDVTILDGGKVIPAGIWMNHELEYKGWKLFQSSYQQESGRSATVLSVSRDPGQPIAFTGYMVLLFGMTIVLATRAAQARKTAPAGKLAPGGVKEPRAVRPAHVGVTLAVLLALTGGAAQAGTYTEVLRRLPVQHDGRVMPLDTVAREAVWKVTGKAKLEGADPVDTVLWWMFDPQGAANGAFIDVPSVLAEKVGLPAGPASFEQLVSTKPVLDLMDEARRMAQQEKQRSGALAAAEKLEEKLVKLQAFLQRDELRVMPVADPLGKWGIAKAASLEELAQLAQGPRLAGWTTPDEIERELSYNAVRPTRVAWIVLGLALVLTALTWRKNVSAKAVKILDALSLIGLIGGFAAMSWGIAMRWMIADRVPAANMYESLLFLGWGVGLFAVVAFGLLKIRMVVLNANAMAFITMALTDLLPIDRFIHPVPPVLAGTPWLAIHVPIIMVSYSVLALGMVIAHIQLGYTIFAPARREAIAKMGDLLYWYILVGATLLVAGILTGSMWASSSWGRYWGWDPKEVWSLIAFLGYMAILHARWDKLLDQFRVAAISILAFQTVLMTYLGVNFVLTTGLHSYGMGDSPVVFWMAVTAITELAFVAVGWISQRRQHQQLVAA
jgi:cytochrome c-type biogenesis protein CcsB